MRSLETVKKLVDDNPNDSDLGLKVRCFIKGIEENTLMYKQCSACGVYQPDLSHKCNSCGHEFD